MSVRRPVVVGWALLVVGGWAATLWLGEPVATAGPGPAPAARVSDDDNPEPGPQPEGSCPTARPTPTPSASALELLKEVPGEHAHLVQVFCAYTEVRTGAR